LGSRPEGGSTAGADACRRWACVNTHPQAERWAQQNLERRGYRTYLPLVLVEQRDRVVPSLRHQVLRPLFASYLFLEHAVGSGWSPVLYSPGVRAVVTAGSRLQYARAGAVEALQAGEAVRRSVTPSEGCWRPGAACQVGDGALQGDGAVVMAVRSDSVVVELLVFGQLTRAVVAVAALRRM